MRFLFKTAYTQDLGLFRDAVQRNTYVALLAGLLVLPKVVPDYFVDVTLVFIYGLCGLSLMTLAGYTGLVSLGHAAFLGIGAYAHVFFAHDLKMPWVLSVALAAAVTAAAGVLVGLPALRMTGVYLSIAEYANAIVLYLARCTPIDCAAISLSRMATHARPVGERSTLAVSQSAPINTPRQRK